MKTVIVTGTVAYDYIFNFDNYFSNYILPEKVHQINISLLTEHYKKSFGGTAGNQAFYLNKLGIGAHIFATGGSDFAEYKKFLVKHKINPDLIKIIRKTHTASGFAITDKKDNQIWMYSKGAMKYAKYLSLNPLVKQFEDFFVLITPNEPKAVDKFVKECIKYNFAFGFDVGFNIPITSKETLSKGIKFSSLIFGNDYEIKLMEERTGIPIKRSLKSSQILIETLADQGSNIYTDGNKNKVGIYRVKTIDPTGAGDAYRAGFLYGYLNGKSPEMCGQMGAVTASFAVEVKGTMNPKFTRKEFEKRLSRIKS